MSDTLRAELEARITRALAEAGAPDAPAIVQPAARPEFGDYQANGVMGAAKRMKTNPRALAERVADLVDTGELIENVEVAGPGFLNLTLSARALADRLDALTADVLTARPANAGDPPVVVDYSSPNLAKEMHVGHIRTTAIGDAIARILEHTGHAVVRQNHVGDWGTQFGMLLAFMDELASDGDATSLDHELADLESFYRQAKARDDADEAFRQRARETVVALQSGDERCRERWRQFIDVSLSHCQDVYDRLGITLTREHVAPESQYNDDLPQVIEDLATAGLLTESDGAQCVFLDEFKGKDDAPLPLIVQKSDGAYLYATTDLAAVRHRDRVIGTKRSLYFVDKRQSLHFKQVFAVARAAGFAPDDLSLEHMPFGTILGDDGKPFKTRSGDVVKLADLLDEAEERAFALVSEKNGDLDEDERRAIARVVGIGAVKYADLSKNRASDYVFSWDTMLAFEGNTAPYLQYAVSRIRSLFRRAGVQPEGLNAHPAIEAPAERALAIQLARLPETLEQVIATGQPHLLCTHLYDIAVGFSAFYEQCPVLSAESPLQEQRLALAALTERTLTKGLSLLGIETLDRM